MANRLRVNRGTTYKITLEYKKDGEPATLVGAVVRFTVKEEEFDADVADSSALIVKNVTSHADAAAGISLIELDPEDTQELEPGSYFYDLKVEESNGDIYKIDEGSFELDGSPTNRID